MTAAKPNPYSSFPPRQFWRTAISEQNVLGITDIHEGKFQLDRKGKIITFGSCFAQALSGALTRNGFRWTDYEPAPPMMFESSAREFGYGVFSARTDNIYTSSSLAQWLGWAFDPASQDDEYIQANGRFFDPVRPRIEPEGFASVEELFRAREQTLAAIRRAVTQAQVLIFTFGLTESWRHRVTGLLYQMCPGTQAGEFDADKHEWKNDRCSDVVADFDRALALMHRHNPDVKVILTVSPVSIVATADIGKHVLTANTYTKSTLRAAAGELSMVHEQVDYFPSYELTATPPFRGMFYRPNLRRIAPAGVDFVVRAFFDAYFEEGSRAADASVRQPEEESEPTCAEMVLDYYNGR